MLLGQVVLVWAEHQLEAVHVVEAYQEIAEFLDDEGSHAQPDEGHHVGVIEDNAGEPVDRNDSSHGYSFALGGTHHNHEAADEKNVSGGAAESQRSQSDAVLHEQVGFSMLFKVVRSKEYHEEEDGERHEDVSYEGHHDDGDSLLQEGQ